MRAQARVRLCPGCVGHRASALQVALEMRRSGMNFNVGQTIPYVICKGDNPSFALRAHHPQTIVRSAGLLAVDIDW